MTRALVTGATGLVGSHIVERLLADGWSVRALVRDAAAASWLGGAGAELARGELLDANSLRAAVSG
ncbi:MAG: NAD(P)H-binding protein, partial [Gemmatimonadaceae bacterium]|nr:NAD(P)H-binding protein [Gemmatimonadaceae bacterium]